MIHDIMFHHMMTFTIGIDIGQYLHILYVDKIKNLVYFKHLYLLKI
jgi:hypothetical protein